MINFYGELTKIIIIVLTTTSMFLLINQNASWKACAQELPKAKTRKTTKNVKMTRMVTLLFLQKIMTPTPPELVANTTKILPWKSNNILPHWNLILSERRRKKAMINWNC